MSTLAPTPPPSWISDLTTPPPTRPKNTSIPDPPGYTAPSNTKKGSGAKDKNARKPPSQEDTDQLKIKKAWEVAFAPMKQLPMNAIGIYMTPNTLQIFSITLLYMLFKTPLVSIFSLNSTFARFVTPRTSSQFLLIKAAYVATNLLALALGIYKVNKMGLLPTTRSDWLAWEGGREWDLVAERRGL
ncbi:DUF1077-domain-containing protein [Patellaria atrata CBS 101060]|uniref:ER membrane protein complex subunit 4 n=1 Tax=Patellaria atrata CBS 101060 TaxID=1346257 RepID=A0A9P4VQ05_9PEZI|nr:DUF1077-domain-containing protein [Patellaria atrata CBS 101060]